MHPFPKDYNQSVKWARMIIQDPSKWIILDTEATGIGKDDVVVQLAIINLDAKSLLNTYIKPLRRVNLSREAVALHGITHEMLIDAPHYKDIYSRIQKEIGEKGIIAYNADYDRRLLKQTAYQDGAPTIKAVWHCAMLQYSRYRGQWNKKRQSYTYQKLPDGDHSAVGDCKATLAVIKEMAISPLAI